MPNMIQIIKQAAMEAVTASSPASILYGTVIGVSPMSINIDQKFTISSDFIVLTRNVTDYKVKIEIDGVEKEVKVKNHLSNGDRVILLQEQGGQRFVVIDKAGG